MVPINSGEFFSDLKKMSVVVKCPSPAKICCFYLQHVGIIGECYGDTM